MKPIICCLSLAIAACTAQPAHHSHSPVEVRDLARSQGAATQYREYSASALGGNICTQAQRSHTNMEWIRFGLPFFAHNSAGISREQDHALRSLSLVLLAQPFTGGLVVVGHADVTGDSQYNRRLSQRRARAIATRLTTLGIAPEYIHTVGLGESAGSPSPLTRLADNGARRADILLFQAELAARPAMRDCSDLNLSETKKSSAVRSTSS